MDRALFGSWAGHGVSGAGVRDHVRVFEDVVPWPSTGGDMTICLAPGREANFDGAADAHVGDEDRVE
ncbi:hypothetical protein [Streptomyces sp. NPDC059787]|uniref:hypothetical protein n=1 Tax=Streptomyces sp. NPDC059787 TaxID=3346947 RepID=UPI00364D492F